MIPTTEIDIQTCTDLYEYRDGELFHKVARRGGVKAGGKAGHFCNTSGYYRVRILGKTYSVHRVIYAMHHGTCPSMIDHIDQDKTNNKIENLRECDKKENVVNSKVRIDNKYGYKGVTFHKASGKFAAQTMWNKKRLHLGLYQTPEEAALAYNKKMLELSPNFAKLNNID